MLIGVGSMLWWIIGAINTMGDTLLKNQKQAIEQANADRKIQFDQQKNFLAEQAKAQAANQKHYFETFTANFNAGLESLKTEIVAAVKNETDKIGETAGRIEANTQTELTNQTNTLATQQNTVQQSAQQAKAAAQNAEASAIRTRQTVKAAIPVLKPKPNFLQRIFSAPQATPTPRHRRK
jgi:hypothetical protein